MFRNWTPLIGLWVGLGVAIAPRPALAADPERVELDTREQVQTESRWQPTDRAEDVVGPWQLEHVADETRKVAETPEIARYQQVRVQQYRQRTVRYPLEAQEVRTHTTRIHRYEIRTYGEQRVCQTLTSTRSVESGAWVPTTRPVPVTAVVKKTIKVPTLVSQRVPYTKTVVSTVGVPGVPLKFSLTTMAQRTEPYVVAETRYRTAYRGAASEHLYDGPVYDTSGANKDHEVGHLRVTDWLPSGQDCNCTYHFTGPMVGRNSDYFNYDTDDTEVIGVPTNVAANGRPTHDWYNVSFYAMPASGARMNFRGPMCWVEDAGDHDEIVAQTHRSWFWWTWTTRFRLAGRIHWTDQQQQSYQEPYTVMETRTRTVNVPIYVSLQGEHMVNHPKDLCGTDPSHGVFWGSYDWEGHKSPYGTPTCKFGWTFAGGQFRFAYLGSPDYFAALNAPAAGNLARHIKALAPEAQGAFTYVVHHTDVMPIFADDTTEPTVTTQSQTILAYQYRMVWVDKERTVFETVPVQHVVRWDPLPLGLPYYLHRHGADPTHLCDDRHVSGTPGDGFVEHDAIPVWGPLTRDEVSWHWATSSVVVSEPRTVWVTASVVVETTPGEEVSQSVSPWRETGQVRRGSIPWVSDAFRTAETILAQFAMAGRYGTASSICAASGGQHHATYTSDFSGSGMASHQRLTGKQLQATLRTTQVVASKFSVRAVIQKPAKNKKRKDEEPSQDLVGLLEVGGRHRFHPDRPRLLIRGTERRSPRWEHSLERGRTQSARE